MTIGKKKKSKKMGVDSVSKFKKETLPKSGFKRVAKSVLVQKGGYAITNIEQLKPFFNKDGSLKKSALRSNVRKKIFKSELAKAKEEIKDIRQENARKREREKEERRARVEKEREKKENERLKQELEKAKEEIERLKKEKEELEKRQKEEKEQQEKTEKEKRREKAKADKEKRERQKETYQENHENGDLNKYEDFIDILESVYDEVDLYFYDSDQVMSMMDNENLSYQDIVEFLVRLNKDKEKELTTLEKKLLKNENVRKIGMQERNDMHEEVAKALYLSGKSDLSPEQWYSLKQTNYPDYVNKLQNLLTPEELDEFVNDIR